MQLIATQLLAVQHTYGSHTPVYRMDTYRDALSVSERYATALVARNIAPDCSPRSTDTCHPS